MSTQVHLQALADEEGIDLGTIPRLDVGLDELYVIWENEIPSSLRKKDSSAIDVMNHLKSRFTDEYKLTGTHVTSSSADQALARWGALWSVLDTLEDAFERVISASGIYESDQLTGGQATTDVEDLTAWELISGFKYRASPGEGNATPSAVKNGVYEQGVFAAAFRKLKEYYIAALNTLGEQSELYNKK